MAKRVERFVTPPVSCIHSCYHRGKVFGGLKSQRTRFFECMEQWAQSQRVFTSVPFIALCLLIQVSTPHSDQPCPSLVVSMSPSMAFGCRQRVGNLPAPNRANSLPKTRLSIDREEEEEEDATKLQNEEEEEEERQRSLSLSRESSV